MSAIKKEEPLWRHLLRALPLILGIAICMFACTWLGLFHQWEMMGLDPLLRFFPPAKDSNIVIVEITDDDYEHLFGDSSPLNRCRIWELIETIERGDPDWVVVDLDLSDSPAITPACRPPKGLSFPEVVENGLNPRHNITWAQVVERSRKPKEEPRLKALSNIDWARLAVPLFPRDRDGAVRSYLRWVKVKDAEGRCYFWPSIPWAALHPSSAAPKPCQPEMEEQELFFNFGGDRYAFDRTDVASILGNGAERDPEDLKRLLEGKMVLIGGNYAAARDEYFTPAGPIRGVDLIAYALETEKRHGGIWPIQETLVFFLDLALGLVIVTFGHYYSLPKALGLGIAAGILLPILFSYLVFHTLNFWLSFVPVALGALLHIVWDGIRDLLKEHRELEELKHENEELRERIERISSEQQPVIERIEIDIREPQEE